MKEKLKSLIGKLVGVNVMFGNVVFTTSGDLLKVCGRYMIVTSSAEIISFTENDVTKVENSLGSEIISVQCQTSRTPSNEE